MPSVEETVAKILTAATWDQRVAQVRLVAQHHGLGEHVEIFAEVAREGYVPHLAPDFAYIHEAPFYERAYFVEVYDAAAAATNDFTLVTEDRLIDVIREDPRTLLVFRTILGLTKSEFAHTTALVAEAMHLKGLTAGKVDSMERTGTPVSSDQARVVVATLTQILDGSLFGAPGGDLRPKLDKLDTRGGWASVQQLAVERVPYGDFLHQRHYGGAFRQVLDATSTRRGDLLEDAVEQLFLDAGVPFLRTGAHNQSEIAKRFEISVAPAPDFVVFDASDSLRAILECKLVNDGGTARDKALRFERLRTEALRLGGIPLLAVLAGMGWTRVNDTLGPVVRDTDGRVFTISTLREMLDVAPFPTLRGLSSHI
ncbi:MAG: hypothetical protein M3Y17_11840 [Actinomycetota bacterium]|nr:hypothetical protein [Actinomycetota bacterium]